MEKATKRKSPVRTKHVFDSLQDSFFALALAIGISSHSDGTLELLEATRQR